MKLSIQKFRKDAQHLLEYLLFLAGMIGVLLIVASPEGIIRQKTQDSINAVLDSIKDGKQFELYEWVLTGCGNCSAKCSAGEKTASGTQKCTAVCQRADGMPAASSDLCIGTEPNAITTCTISCPVDCWYGEAVSQGCEVISRSDCGPLCAADPNKCFKECGATPNNCDKIGREVWLRDTVPAQNGGEPCDEATYKMVTKCTPPDSECSDPVCGNRIIEGAEGCDAGVFNPVMKTCAQAGFSGGSLRCGENCQLDTSLCFNYVCDPWEDNGCEELGADLSGVPGSASCGVDSGEVRQNRTCRKRFYTTTNDVDVVIPWSVDANIPGLPDNNFLSQCVDNGSCSFDCQRDPPDQGLVAPNNVIGSTWCDPLRYDQDLPGDGYGITFSPKNECPSYPADVKCQAECPVEDLSGLMDGGSDCGCSWNFEWKDINGGSRCYCVTSDQGNPTATAGYEGIDRNVCSGASPAIRHDPSGHGQYDVWYKDTCDALMYGED